MFGKKKKGDKSYFSVADRKIIHSTNGMKIIELDLKVKKPIPPASQGTLRLRGKQ
jgi:hypothetical protein